MRHRAANILAALAAAGALPTPDFKQRAIDDHMAHQPAPLWGYGTGQCACGQTISLNKTCCLNCSKLGGTTAIAGALPPSERTES